MSWICDLHDKRPDDPQPGDIWPAPWLLRPERRDELSPAYFRDHAAKRPPLIVQLPGRGGPFCMDALYANEAWTVTGDPPNITVSPSINAVGDYHGWLQNGVLSDDCEGRTFPQGGN